MVCGTMEFYPKIMQAIAVIAHFTACCEKVILEYFQNKTDFRAHIPFTHTHNSRICNLNVVLDSSGNHRELSKQVNFHLHLVIC